MAASPNPLSLVIISLMKGVNDREADPAIWQSLLALQARVRDHVSVLGLDLIVDEAEGYAYLRQRPVQDGEVELPRLIARRQLGYYASLLLALLRKKLVEFDATSGESRLILARDEIVEMMRLFLPDGTNQVRMQIRRVGFNSEAKTGTGFLNEFVASFRSSGWKCDSNDSEP